MLKLNPVGSGLIYSTFLGGGGQDRGFGIALDQSGNAYVTGITDSLNFNVYNAFQPQHAGGQFDAFVAKITDNSAGQFDVFAAKIADTGTKSKGTSP